MKRINLKSLLMVASFAFFGGNVHAASLAGVDYPDKMTVDGKELVLNGLGLRTVSRFGLTIKVYVMALYVPEKAAEADKILASEGPKVYQMTFVRNVDSADIQKGWQTGYTNNCGEHCKANEDKIKQFNGLMSDIRNKQTMTVTAYQNKIHVDVKGRKPKSATIEGEEFARIIEKIWLGVPPNEELKAGILGGKS